MFLELHLKYADRTPKTCENDEGATKDGIWKRRSSIHQQPSRVKL